MFCSNCGQELPQGSKFCMSCGKSLSENSSIEIQSRDTDNTQGVLKVVRVSGMTALALKTQIYVDGDHKLYTVYESNSEKYKKNIKNSDDLITIDLDDVLDTSSAKIK